MIPGSLLKHAYIPDVYGKERRKRQRGKEGKLGVEGMPPQVLEQVLRRAGATFLDEGARSEEAGPPLTKADLFAAGLSGGADSGARRLALLKRLGAAGAYVRQRTAGRPQRLLQPGGGAGTVESEEVTRL